MPLNQKQQEAVDYLDGPLLVLAGPGTGKTQLLSAKVAHILESLDVSPENILCLTFTEAGASNMRERLLSMIGPDANKVNIHTYHAFGSDILGQYKNYAENFDRNLDEPIDTVTQYKIINEVVNALPITDILRTNDIKDIISTISDIKSAGLSSEDLFKISQINLSETKELNEKISEILEEVVPRMKPLDALPIYKAVDDVLKDYVSLEPIVGHIEKEANELARTLALAIEEVESAEKPKLKPLSDWRKNYFEKDNNNRDRLKNFVANKKLVSLANVLKSYEDYLKENNLFDYDDMIQQSISILETDDGFRYTLQERYQYILLDEFQDTNPSQFKLVELVSNEEQTYIMAVGDDDQAIYEFQGATANNLLDFYSKYNAKVINLSENYRSTTEIIELGRKIADKIENSFAKAHDYNKVLTSARNDEILGGEKSPLVERHEFLSADSEYAFIAKKIADLIDSGEKQKDIAILAPKHKYIAPLLPYLKSYDNINIAYEKRENVLEDPYIHELSVLARFIYEVGSGADPSFRLLEILSFPFLEVPALDAISALKTNFDDKRTVFEYLSEKESLKPTMTLLSELVMKSFDAPLELFIDYLTGNAEIKAGVKSPFLDFYTAKVPDFKTYNLYENLAVLREHIKSHVKTEKPRLKDFIDFLDDYELAGEAILNTSPYQDSENSVQILTAHKSKGLEFKHVFIISVDDLSWGKGKGNNNRLTLPYNLQVVRHTGITDDERLRLFFVAITRAEKTLTLTNSIQDFSGKKPKRLAYLEEYEGATGSIVSPLLKDTDVVEHYEEISEEERRENVENYWLSNYLNLTPDLKPVLEKSVENFPMTATKLTSFIDIAYSGPLDFYRNYILKAPGEPSSSDMIFGNLIHETFEKVTNEKMSDADALAFFRSEVLKLDLEESEKSDLKERGEIALTESLKAFRPILVPEKLKARAEVNLGPEHLVFNGVPLTGKIDHINIDEENKTIEIYDFKTGNFHDKNWGSHPTLYKYTLQLMFYKLLLNLSPTYNKYKIEKAHILFVSPKASDLAVSEIDAEVADLVHDKLYLFNPEEETDFKELLEAVYRHIKSLDFIDENSPLAVYPDSKNGIKQIREFVDLVKNN
ncbi:MAG: ATP-dependent DNA helicase [Candidatus Saccharibacteria bacterium]|nr:ATP-dependent DNA helicase [Candidatus Saccharibacteria bacterium]